MVYSSIGVLNRAPIGAGADLPKIISDAFSAIATTPALVFATTRRG